MHEITAGHRSLSGTISCVTNRIHFLPVTMTGSFSNFNNVSYREDRHKLRVTGTKCQLPDTMSGTGEIFISGAEMIKNSPNSNFIIAKIYTIKVSGPFIFKLLLSCPYNSCLASSFIQANEQLSTLPGQKRTFTSSIHWDYSHLAGCFPTPLPST